MNFIEFAKIYNVKITMCRDEFSDAMMFRFKYTDKQWCLLMTYAELFYINDMNEVQKIVCNQALYYLNKDMVDGN